MIHPNSLKNLWTLNGGESPNKGRPQKNPNSLLNLKHRFPKNHIPWNKGLKGYNSGEKSHWWRGGVQKSGNGYLYLYKPEHPNADKRSRVLEHRFIMEQKLGRYLLPSENVHHINKIKTDNRPENLKLYSSIGEHLSDEFSGRITPWNKFGKEAHHYKHGKYCK